MNASPEFSPAPPPPWALENAPPPERLISRPGHLRLALTGGIASGKSLAARLFCELGAKEIDFDALARQAAEPGTKAAQAAPDIFGPAALGPDGRLNRPFVAQSIFGDSNKKEAWESLLHPEIWRLMAQKLDELADEEALIISVPLLFESGLESFFPEIILVAASPDRQLARLLARNPEMTEDTARKIMAAQWPLAAKLRAARHVIDNNGSRDECALQVRALWKTLRG